MRERANKQGLRPFRFQFNCVRKANGFVFQRAVLGSAAFGAVGKDMKLRARFFSLFFRPFAFFFKFRKRNGIALGDFVIFYLSERNFVFLNQIGQGKGVLFTKRLRHFHCRKRVVHRAVRRERNAELLRFSSALVAAFGVAYLGVSLAAPVGHVLLYAFIVATGVALLLVTRLAPGRLTDEEFGQIKKHPLYGEHLLHNVEGDTMLLAREVALEHHERYDGKGYPYGTRGEDISLEGRIVAVADVYDALTSRRSYKDAWDPKAAYDEIVRCSGTQFDPRVVDAFVAAYDQIDAARRQYADEHITNKAA